MKQGPTSIPAIPDLYSTTKAVPLFEADEAKREFDPNRDQLPDIPQVDISRPLPPPGSTCDNMWYYFSALNDALLQRFKVRECALSAMMAAKRLIANGEISRPAVPLQWMCSPPPRCSTQQEEFPVAGFYKPLEYNWSQEQFDVDLALIEYLDRSHADH